MLSKKNSMVTMVTDEFLENRKILQKSVATIGFICFFWFQKCILLYIFAQVFLVMRSIRSHISLFRLGFTPTLRACNYTIFLTKKGLQIFLHKGALPWTPVKGFAPGPMGGPRPRLWVLAFRARCFSLQDIPKSWKPWYLPEYFKNNVFILIFAGKSSLRAYS